MPTRRLIYRPDKKYNTCSIIHVFLKSLHVYIAPYIHLQRIKCIRGAARAIKVYIITRRETITRKSICHPTQEHNLTIRADGFLRLFNGHEIQIRVSEE